MCDLSVVTPSTCQRGIALITSLIFLVILTIIGVTAARMATLEERMAGNMRDRTVALRAAEMALRDAERDILFGRSIVGLTGFTATCTNGLCYKPAGFSPPVWTTVSMTAAPSVSYGQFTSAAPIVGVSAQPRYLIEGMRKSPPGGGLTYYYQITVRAQGQNPNTVVWLQEMFAPR